MGGSGDGGVIVSESGGRASSGAVTEAITPIVGIARHRFAGFRGLLAEGDCLLAFGGGVDTGPAHSISVNVAKLITAAKNAPITRKTRCLINLIPNRQSSVMTVPSAR